MLDLGYHTIFSVFKQDLKLGFLNNEWDWVGINTYSIPFRFPTGKKVGKNKVFSPQQRNNKTATMRKYAHILLYIYFRYALWSIYISLLYTVGYIERKNLNQKK